MKKILGLDSAYDEATHSKHGANMTTSAKLVCEMAERIWELEAVVSKTYEMSSDINEIVRRSIKNEG